MFLLEESIKLLWKVYEEGKANKEHLNSKYPEFLKVTSKAVRQTLSYIGKSERNRKTEEELSELWANVAVAAQPFDSDFAERCYLKGNYWANRDNWTDQEVENAGIEIKCIEKEIGGYYKGKARAKKLKQLKTIEKTEPDTKSKEEGMIVAHKPWYKKAWSYITGAVIFLAAIIAILWYSVDLKQRLFPPQPDKVTVKQSEKPNLPSNSVVVNNVVYDIQPTANKIIAEIESLPAYEQKAAAENYKGRLFKWSLRFDNLVQEQDGTVYVICQASAVRGEVTFTINPDEKENLKIKKIKKFKFLDVSGEIEEIFMFREPQISLKDVRLEFFD